MSVARIVNQEVTIMKRSSVGFCLVLAASLMLVAQPSFARDRDSEDFIKDTSEIGKDFGGVVRSDQFLELGVITPNGLRMEGEQAMRMGNHDRAITVLQRAVEMTPWDMDGRILYSQALERKLMRQRERDPKLYNFLIKQWLFVAKKADFMDQSLQGMNHLAKLTGSTPSKWETAGRYLKRVLIPEDGSVKVAMGGKKSKPGEKPRSNPIVSGKDGVNPGM